MRLTLPPGYRHASVLLFLLLTPLLARADALDGVALMLQILAAVVGVALLGIGLTLLAYFRPQSRLLQVLSGVGLATNLFIGVLWQQVFSGVTSLSGILQGYNPFLSLAVPLGLWLGGVTWARRETRPGRRLVWVVVAVFGANLLLAPLLYLLLWNVLGLGNLMVGGLRWGLWVLDLALLFGTWWLVLEQAQRHWRLDWHTPRLWVLAPALETGLGILYSFTTVFLSMGRGGELAEPGQFLASLLGFGVVRCAVSVLAMWLNQRRYSRSAPVPEELG